jgi:hypothetical protein
MLTLRRISGFGFIGFKGDPIPQVTVPDEVIDGFPEFGDRIDSTDPKDKNDPKKQQEEKDAKDKLRKLAKRIVQSRASGRRIIGFVCHGHADQTLRFGPGPQRDALEQEVSDDRAENAKKLLLQMIEEEGGKPFIAGIRANATAKGFGSQFRIFTPAKTEAQMRKNRRVEIFLREFIDPPPSPPPAPKPPTPPDNGSHWSIQVLGGTTLNVASPIPFTDVLGSLTVTLDFEVIDKDRKQKQKFRYVGTGASIGAGVSLGAAGLVTITKGTAVSFETTKGTALDQFVGSADVVQEPGAGISALSAGGEFGFEFTEMGKIGTRLKGDGKAVKGNVVDANAGQGLATLPSAGSGATTGTIVKVGDVQNL